MKVLTIILMVLVGGCGGSNEHAIDGVYNDPTIFNCDSSESEDQSIRLLKSIMDKRVVLGDKWLEVYKNGYATNESKVVLEFCVKGLDIIIPKSKLTYGFGTDNPKDGGIVNLINENNNQQFDILDVKTSCLFEKCNNSQPISKIAFLGNSLTIHGINENIGWHGSWGMAATTQENDYVHKTLSMLGKNIEYGVFGINGWESQFEDFDYSKFSGLISYNPDIIIINVGENIDENKHSKDEIIKHIEFLYDHLSNNTKSKIILVSSFWNYNIVNSAFYEYSTKNQKKLVEIGDISLFIENTAINEYQNYGVGSHPSDIGMELIAKRIVNNL